MTKIELCSTACCTGCMACKQTCKHNAIKYKVFDDFIYPIIEEEDCTQCGLCVKSCPVINNLQKKGNIHENEKKCIAAWSKDVSVRLNSSSGGIFSMLANWILEKNGVVFGAAWDNQMVLRHKSIRRKADLDELRRSKYVQSDIGETYKEARAYLEQGEKVLFSGTPCQIAGLVFYLGKKKYENLFTVDVLCQGISSPLLFKKYLTELETEYGARMIDCNFRTKIKGWRCGLMLFLLSEKGQKIKRTLLKNEYYNAFIKEYFMRESCYKCRFKNCDLGYYSDITIADFWRIGSKSHFDISDYEKGISAIIINTPKGEELLNQIKDNIYFVERSWEEFSTNTGLYHSQKPLRNDEALEHLHNNSWNENQKKYYQLTLKEWMSHRLWLLIGEKNIRRIKKIYN